MAIDSKLPKQVCFQLETVLLEEILDAATGWTDAFPTEHELCARTGSAGRQ